MNSSPPISDAVFPIGRLYDGEIAIKGKSIEYGQMVDLQGTGFLIGNRGFGMTASHVLNSIDKIGDEKVILYVQEEQWLYSKIIEEEHHPTEDVAIFRTQSFRSSSFLEISESEENSSFEYQLWGYPDSVANELHGQIDTSKIGYSPIKPELIYQTGYFRRRISREMNFSIYKGSSFYEVSESAGACCSGSPVIKKNRKIGNAAWPVVGVYVGESGGKQGKTVGLVVRSSSFSNWTPSILGRRVIEEA